MRICSYCKIEKPESEFYKHPYQDGLKYNCKSCHNSYSRKWNKENKERLAATKAKWTSENRRHCSDYANEWRKLNPEKEAATKALRRAAERCIPSWANQFFISEAYKLAKLRTSLLGYPWHVDHIVPLQHKLVCGLHVHDNLRVIPAVVNRKKGNRYWPNMPGTP